MFSGLNYESETLSRQINVTELDQEMRLFEYSESIRVTDDEQQFFYEDNFQIRCWDSEIILAEFEAASMRVREDVSDRFVGSGAQYFILTKS